MVAKIQSEKVYVTTRNTRSKTALIEQKIKDPNAGVFSDTSGYAFETLNLNWSRIYAIFDNDDFFFIDHDQPAYMRIRKSQLHCIVVRPPFMPYTNLVKWALDHVDLNQRMFHDIDNVYVTSFNPDVFARDYNLEAPMHLF